MVGKKIPNPIDAHVGNRVRLRRQMIGMSQEKLGELLDITFQQVQKYEKGVNRISASRLQSIANVLSTPVSFFFEDAPGAEIPASGFQDAGRHAYVPDMLLSSEGLTLNRAFAKIKNPKVRRKIVELINVIANEA